MNDVMSVRHPLWGTGPGLSPSNGGRRSQTAHPQPHERSARAQPAPPAPLLPAPAAQPCSARFLGTTTATSLALKESPYTHIWFGAGVVGRGLVGGRTGAGLLRHSAVPPFPRRLHYATQC